MGEDSQDQEMTAFIEGFAEAKVTWAAGQCLKFGFQHDDHKWCFQRLKLQVVQVAKGMSELWFFCLESERDISQAEEERKIKEKHEAWSSSVSVCCYCQLSDQKSSNMDDFGDQSGDAQYHVSCQNGPRKMFWFNAHDEIILAG